MPYCECHIDSKRREKKYLSATLINSVRWSLCRMRQVPGISVEGLGEGTAPPHLDPPATPTPLHAAVYDWHEDDDDDDFM